MLTIPYSYYTDVYGGSLTEAEFNKAIRPVVVDVNYYTNNTLLHKRVQDVSTALLNSYRMLCCRLVDNSVSYEAEGGVVVKSRKAGKVSEAYLESSLPRSRGTSIREMINKYLGSYGLDCRWV